MVKEDVVDVVVVVVVDVVVVFVVVVILTPSRDFPHAGLRDVRGDQVINLECQKR